MEKKKLFSASKWALFQKFIDKSVTGNLEHIFSEKQYDRGWGFIGAPTEAWVSPMQVSSWPNVAQNTICALVIFMGTQSCSATGTRVTSNTYIPVVEVSLHLLCIQLTKKIYDGQEKGVCGPTERGFLEVEGSQGLRSLKGKKERELESREPGRMRCGEVVLEPRSIW